MNLFDWIDKKDVYIGYSLVELAKVKDELLRNGIEYKSKVKNHSGQSLNIATTRGLLGSYGMDMKYEKQYIVSVKSKDYETAYYLINKTMHK